MAVARMQPLVVTPASTTVSTRCVVSSVSRSVPKNALAYFLRMTRSSPTGAIRSSTSTRSLPSSNSRIAGTFSMNRPASP